jgi:Tol biopolymer transport system component
LATPASVRTATGSIFQYRDDTTPISWRPDGKTLAVVLPTATNSTDPSSGASTITIALYNTSSGQVASQLQLATVSNTGGVSPRFATAPTWSPSGQQFAYVDAGYGQVVIWGAGQLPA